MLVKWERLFSVNWYVKVWHDSIILLSDFSLVGVTEHFDLVVPAVSDDESMIVVDSDAVRAFEAKGRSQQRPLVRVEEHFVAAPIRYGHNATTPIYGYATGLA